MSVEDRLRNAVAPDEEGARERALARMREEWARAEEAGPAAAGGLRPGKGRGLRAGSGGLRPGQGRLRGRLAAAAVAALILVAAALSPPGEAVADWVRAAVGLRPELPTDHAPRADRPPSGGRLLVSSAGTTYIVEASGKRRRLGAWTAASWSPHGKFVIAWKGRRLAALDPQGKVRWSLTAPRPISQALWSPSGFRVAYRSGGDLRVVAGDGTGDRLLEAGTFRPAAWRPGARHVLAYTSGSHLNVVDVDAGARPNRIQLPSATGQVAWSPDGTRLYARMYRSILAYDARGRRVGQIRMPRGSTVTTFVPGRDGVAVARGRGVTSEVALMRAGGLDRVLFRADGRFTRLRFSPSGRWLLVAWPLADQWVYLKPGTSGTAGLKATAHVSRRFDARGFPQLQGWCCPP